MRSAKRRSTPAVGVSSFLLLLPALRIVKSDADVVFPDDADLWVYEGLRFQNDLVVAPHDPRPFEEFVRFHPSRPSPGRSKASGSRTKIAPKVTDFILAECPWLDREDIEPVQKPAAKRARRCGDAPARPRGSPRAEDSDGDDGASSVAASGGGADGDGADDDDIEDNEEIDVEGDLADMRARLHVPEDHAEPYFKVSIRGGRWTLEHKDSVADCTLGATNAQLTRVWRAAFSFPLSTSFSFRLYSRPGALALAREFCRRGNYFANLYFEARSQDDFVYTQADVAALDDDLDFVTWMCSLDVDEPAFSKGQEIRELAPDCI